MDRSNCPCSHVRPEDSAGQAPKLKAAGAGTEAEVVEASAPEPLDAGNVNQGYRKADRQSVADYSRKATLSDVTRIVGGGQEGSWEAEAACEARVVSSHRSEYAGHVVRSRLSAKDDGSGGIRLGSVMVEAGRHHRARMVQVLGSRPVDDDTLVETRESFVAAEGGGACSLVQAPFLPSAVAVGPLEPSEAASTDRPMASEDVLAAEHDVRSSPAEEDMSLEATAHDGVGVMEAVVLGPASSSRSTCGTSTLLESCLLPHCGR